MAQSNPINPARQRYGRRFAPLMAAYVIIILGVSYVFRIFEPAGPLAWALAVAPGLPILGLIGAMGLYLKEEADEFQRTVMVEAMLWGLGLTLSGLTVWGLLEFYVDAPKLPVFWAFPIFCAAMGLAQPLVRRRFR